MQNQVENINSSSLKMNFLKYFNGVKPGNRLKRTTPTLEEKKNSKKEYELKRERKFQKQWLINRFWLN